MGRKSEYFTEYYNQYKNKIFVYFLYRVNFNNEVAEDLTSEVFLKALDAFDSFDEDRSFQSWIFTIAHNHLVNYYKRAQRETYELKDNQAVDSHEKMVSLRYELQVILEQINKMEENDKEVLLLRFVDNMNNTEIADLLGKSEGSIRTRISRALDKLRYKLDK